MQKKLVNPKFAPLTLDSTFKKAFANEQCTELLLFLLNTFLAEKLQNPIKEVTFINSEQLGKTRFRRDAIFDVYCKDAAGTRFIVEVQVKGQEHFIKRTFFYLCMIVCSLAVKGKKYDFNIPRLYSISFLEFDLDFGKGCTEVIQHLSIRNDKHPEICYDILQMTFVILPRFKKKESECKTIMDKILFSLKNGHKLKGVPKSFREKELRDIFSIARISNFTEREIKQYEAAMMNRYDQSACIAYAKKEGVAIGEKRGVGKGVLQTAKSMLADGLDLARVARITKLPRKQIMALMRV
ncbi:hypothetical protein R83H12_01153 [Fibrobacteria bacterium R8-3-H12]